MNCASCGETIADRMITVTEEQDVTTKSGYFEGPLEHQLRSIRVAVYCSYKCVAKGVESLVATEAKEAAEGAF